VFFGKVQLSAASGQVEPEAELLTLVQEHSATKHETRQQAQLVLADLEARLPSQALPQPQARRQTKTMAAVTPELPVKLATGLRENSALARANSHDNSPGPIKPSQSAKIVNTPP
jgi:hypothetical protein